MTQENLVLAYFVLDFPDLVIQNDLVVFEALIGLSQVFHYLHHQF